MELIDLVIALQKLARKASEYRLDSRRYLILKLVDRDEIYKQFSNIGFDKVGKDELELNLRNHRGLFYDKKSFLQQCSEKTFEHDIGIIIFEDGYLYFDSTTKIITSNSSDSHVNNFIENAYYYLKFHDEFKRSKVVSYHSSSAKEYVLISPELGKFILGYPPVVPEFPSTVVKEKYSLYQNVNKPQEYEAYFKSHIIKSLRNYEHDQGFPEFVKKLDQLIEDTDKDYEIFVNKFSFEKLRENFKKERDEYFAKVRDIVNQLLSKVVSIPISISASALAIYNLRNDATGVTVVVIAYIVYSLFTSYLFRLIHGDAFELKDDLEKEIEIIKEFAKIETSILTREAKKVFRKIKNLSTTLVMLQLVLAILSTVVLFVYLQFTSISAENLLLLLAFIFDIQMAFAFWGLNQKLYANEQGS